MVELLQRHDHELQSRPNTAHGLKSMTAKQFVDMIQFFRHKITGKSPLPADRQSNPEPELLAFVQRLAYPVTVAKSWFKTPTAPHAYADCVALLAWLADFVTAADDDEAEEDDGAEWPIAGDAELPDDAHTYHFSVKARRAFQPWSKGDDDSFAAIAERLIDANVAARMADRVDTGAALAAFAAELRRSSDQLKVDHAVELATPLTAVAPHDAKLAEAEAQLAAARNERAQAFERHTRTLERHGRLQQRAAEQSTKMAKLQHTVQAQRYTTMDVQQQAACESVMRRTIAMRTNELDEVRQFEASQQIAVARAKQQFDERLKAFAGSLLACERMAGKLPAKVRTAIAVPRLLPSDVCASIRAAIAVSDTNAELIGRCVRGLKHKAEENAHIMAHLAAEMECLREQLRKHGQQHQEIEANYLDGDKALIARRMEYDQLKGKCDKRSVDFDLMHRDLQQEKERCLRRVQAAEKENMALYERKAQKTLLDIQRRNEQAAEIDKLCQMLDGFWQE